MLKISNAKIIDDDISKGNIYIDSGKIVAVTDACLPLMKK